MNNSVKNYADFRVSEDNEILIILDEELFDPMKTITLKFSGDSITSVDGKIPLELTINHPELVEDIKKCKKIHLVEKTDAGFFQIIPNIKLIRSNT